MWKTFRSLSPVSQWRRYVVRKRELCLIVAVIVVVPCTTLALDVVNTKLLSQPAISESHLAFVYANDLWVAQRDGAGVRRLTSDEGVEANPVFSPDGEWIAFNAEYDGNTDVYLIPVSGGMPQRLTWHPYSDGVCSFTPDGTAVLFRSGRTSFTNRYTQLFTVPLAGGVPHQLPVPYGVKASYSPDGTRLAYTPLQERFRVWKNYRGGTVTTILLYTFADHSTVKIPQPESRCNDTDPQWVVDTVYFLSDRNGEFNLFAYNTQLQTVEQLTHYDDFPIVDASYGGGSIIFEQAGSLHTYDISTGRSDDLTIGVAADLQELRPRFVKGAKYLRWSDISPSGSRAVFEVRGEIVTVPAEHGDPRNLTNTPGAHERNPAWSPDGTRIAFLSDASGEYRLQVVPQDGKGETRTYPLQGTGFYHDLTFSPDNSKIAYEDNGRNLYILSLDSGATTRVDTEPIYNPGAFGGINPVWSPDSKWLAYTLNIPSNMEQVYLYSLEQANVFAVADGLSDVGNPVFDKSGKYLCFLVSTDAGPVRQWFAMSNADMEMSRNLYLVTLQEGEKSPFAKKSDEEESKEDDGEKEKDDKDQKKSKEEIKPVVVDMEGIDRRIVPFPLASGNYFSLQAGKEGVLFYLKARSEARGPFQEGTKLMMFDLDEREEKEVCEANDFVVSADGSKILYRKGETWSIIDAQSKPDNGKGALDLDAISLKIDPPLEWAQIFDEAWRVYRDYFYATNYHGADWEAMREKYRPFLQHLACRRDLNRLIRWMASELSVGHNNVFGGDQLFETETIEGGLLGADYTIDNGRYRFAKVYGGLNWTPELISPLTEPGVDVIAGEYLLAVNGVELVPPDNLYARFENTAGKLVELTVGPNPSMQGSRVVAVVPISDEYNLRNRDWVEGNIRKVDEATDGRVAYVYLPNTTTLGHTYFKRYFFPQVNKQAIILDERFNGGGQIADYYINILQRPYISHWHMRYGQDLKTPQGSIQGPKVMLIDETAGSGGDLLPYMFRKFGLGKLIGKRTWGGLVGMLGYPVLLDGGYVTAPNVAIWDENGWVVENVGVPPDIEVEQTPAEVIAGGDPQLEKAIQVVLAELEENPPRKLERPPYPVRVWQK